MTHILIEGEAILPKHTVMTLHASITRRIVIIKSIWSMLMVMMIIIIRSWSWQWCRLLRLLNMSRSQRMWIRAHVMIY